MHTLVSSSSDYILILADAIDKLTAHSFISKCQSKYLASRKSCLDQKSCIVLLDFAENYHFHVQDEIQRFYWNQGQCTIGHPVVIYYKNHDQLCSASFCYISDDLNHDTIFVHELLSHVTSLVSSLDPRINSIQYFLDGCAGQYKNMFNLCFHKSDFNMAASWSFFTTSHGPQEFSM